MSGGAARSKDSLRDSSVEAGAGSNVTVSQTPAPYAFLQRDVIWNEMMTFEKYAVPMTQRDGDEDVEERRSENVYEWGRNMFQGKAAGIVRWSGRTE